VGRSRATWPSSLRLLLELLQLTVERAFADPQGASRLSAVSVEPLQRLRDQELLGILQCGHGRAGDSWLRPVLWRRLLLLLDFVRYVFDERRKVVAIRIPHDHEIRALALDVASSQGLTRH